jgi:hypothetical protein
MATYKQVDIVTESKQRGGKRENSGAKLKHGEPTKTIRLPISLVEKINSGVIDIATLSKAKDIVTDSNDSELQIQDDDICLKCVNGGGGGCLANHDSPVLTEYDTPQKLDHPLR